MLTVAISKRNKLQNIIVLTPKDGLSGHHANIEKWRREQSVIRTAERRPDLLEKADLTQKEKELVKTLVKEN